MRKSLRDSWVTSCLHNSVTLKKYLYACVRLSHDELRAVYIGKLLCNIQMSILMCSAHILPTPVKLFSLAYWSKQPGSQGWHTCI